MDTGVDLDALLAIGPRPRRPRRPRHPEPRGRRTGAVNDQRGEVLWTPPADAWTATAAGRFATEHGFADYGALHAWSVDDLDGFWRAATEFTGVRWHDAADGDARRRSTMPGVRWFPGATLNYAEHALAARRRAARTTSPSSPAARPADPIELTWAELAADVAAAAAGLRRLGVGAGDRVVAYAPNIPETLVAFLATASIGAIVVELRPRVRRALGDRPLRPDRAGRARRRRRLPLRQPRTSTAAAEVAEIVAALPDAAPRRRTSRTSDPIADAGRHRVVGRPASPTAARAGVRRRSPPTTRCTCCSARARPACPKADRPRPRRHRRRAPQGARPAPGHRPGDRFCWFTTTGWMMWNYLVSGLLTGSTDRALRRRPGGAVARHAVGPRRRDRDHRARRVGAVPDGVPQGRRRARRRARCAGSARPARRCRPTGSAGSTTRVGVPVSSISGGTDVCTAFVGVVAARAGAGRRDQLPRCSGAPSRRSRRTAGRARRA